MFNSQRIVYDCVAQNPIVIGLYSLMNVCSKQTDLLNLITDKEGG